MSRIYIKPIIIGALVVIVGLAGFLALRPNFSKVKADSSVHYAESFTASLAPEQEIGMASTSASSTNPHSGSGSGLGTGTFNLTTDGQTIDYQVSVMNLTSAITAAHLHCAPVGQTGQIIVPLFGTSKASTSSPQATSTTFSGTISTNDILPAAISCNPNIQTMAHLIQAIHEGEIYVNVHTVNFPMGEVRGQLLTSNQIIDFNSTTTATTSPSVATSTEATSTTVSTSTTQTATSTTSTSTSTVSPSPSGWYYVFVQPDSYYKIQGDTITFTGSHFVPGETVTVTLPHTTVTTVSADASGTFTTGPITIPYNIGQRTFTFTGASSQIPFPVQINVGSGSPWIVLNTYYAGAGAPVTISGHQFGGNEPVTITFGGVNVGTATTDAQGNFSLNTTVPNTGQGQWTVSATGGTTNLNAAQSFSQAF